MSTLVMTPKTKTAKNFMIKISGNGIPDYNDQMVDVTDPYAWFNEQKRQAVKGETLSFYRIDEDESLVLIEEHTV